MTAERDITGRRRKLIEATDGAVVLSITVEAGCESAVWIGGSRVKASAELVESGKAVCVEPGETFRMRTYGAVYGVARMGHLTPVELCWFDAVPVDDVLDEAVAA